MQLITDLKKKTKEIEGNIPRTTFIDKIAPNTPFKLGVYVFTILSLTGAALYLTRNK